MKDRPIIPLGDIEPRIREGEYPLVLPMEPIELDDIDVDVPLYYEIIGSRAFKMAVKVSKVVVNVAGERYIGVRIFEREKGDQNGILGKIEKLLDWLLEWIKKRRG